MGKKAPNPHDSEFGKQRTYNPDGQAGSSTLRVRSFFASSRLIHTIYIALLDDDTDWWRPVQANRMREPDLSLLWEIVLADIAEAEFVEAPAS
jgi:hypothetical protein